MDVYSQINNGLQAPDILPKSPEVAGLEKYGEYPVSEYTGIPSIDIPLYTVKAKGIEVPISLNYHATGIQVTQEATWAGLGYTTNDNGGDGAEKTNSFGLGADLRSISFGAVYKF